MDVLSKEVVSLKSMASDQQAPKSPSSTPQQRPLQESQTISTAAGKQTQPPTITKTSPSSRGDRKFNVVVYVTGFAKRYLFHTFDIPANKMM